MRIYAQNKRMRVVQTIGNYMEYRYEVQESYHYYDKDNIINSWHCVFISHDLNICIEYFEKHKNDIEIKPKQSLSEIEYLLSLWK